ncbi:sodium- and chloride-dependent glycine transporter 1-like [Tigriopus californicus]|uniref:sodium- and chloride-dependent glycine transporter 1-like n=1 Tax=Tigriopus californicus TaxID=6832 RepID=UPI0027DA288F|nr:sodium- and chloride-dependent glycine transporter 1-like [Tigriopus californicus]
MMATEQTPLKKTPKDREKWGNQCDFFLSCLGYAVGLGNVWRFPYLCYQHGGGSFLVAYVSMLLLTGLPLFTLELSLGQYSSIGPSQIFKKLCPASKGVGWAMVSVSLLIALYYNQIIAWALFYMYEGLAWELPWKFCGKDFNSIGCFTVIQNEACLNASNGVEVFWNNTCYIQAEVCETSGLDFYNLTHCQERKDGGAFLKLTTVMQRKTASEDYFTRRVLGLRDDSSWDNMGSLQTHAVVSLVGAWALVAVCMLNGIQTSGKVVYFTALFPFLVLLLLFVRGLTLDGAYDGILFYVTPHWDAMWAPQMWADAATQIFYSLGTTMGGLVTLASYNRFNNNCLRDALIITSSNCATSIFAGFVIFSIVGFMAKELEVPISEVIQSGPGLTFVAYPDAVTRLPGSAIWSFLFFMMILTLGLDTQFAMTETVTTAIMDQWPQTRRHKTWVVLGACSLGLAFGLLMCLNGGIFVFQLFDWYSASWNLMLVGFLEIVIVMVCLGYQGVMNNLAEMQVQIPLVLRFYYGLTWRCLTPLSLAGIFTFTLVKFAPCYYEDYVFPHWVQSMGYGIFALTLFVVPLLFLHEGCTNGFNRTLFQSVGWSPPTEDEDDSSNSEGTDYNNCKGEEGVANLAFRCDETSRIATK